MKRKTARAKDLLEIIDCQESDYLFVKEGIVSVMWQITACITRADGVKQCEVYYKPGPSFYPFRELTKKGYYRYAGLLSITRCVPDLAQHLILCARKKGPPAEARKAWLMRKRKGWCK